MLQGTFLVIKYLKSMNMAHETNHLLRAGRQIPPQNNLSRQKRSRYVFASQSSIEAPEARVLKVHARFWSNNIYAAFNFPELDTQKT